jgi:type IV pilus assembly protein PilE
MKHSSPVAAARRAVSGFTLIELMIVVAIVAILAGVAYASYDFAMIKSRRNAAAGCALESAQFMERYYTTNLTYVGAAPPASDCQRELQGHYDFALAASAARTYSITATPQNHQATKDTKCGTLSLDQTGARGITGSASSSSECW